MNPTFSIDQAKQMIGYTDGVHIIGYRASGSQYGKYDDTIAFIAPNGVYFEYEGNTMPSVWRTGIAKLVPGKYTYKQGLHGMHHMSNSSEDQSILKWLEANVGKDYPANLLAPAKLIAYWAFRQNGPVGLWRDGETAPIVDGWPSNPAWVDIHHGGYNLTSSEGCQTIHPDWWMHFRERIYGAMDDNKQTTITYHLIQL